MVSPLIFTLFGCDELATAIQKKCGYDRGSIIEHQFPDDEVVIKIDANVADRTVLFIANLARPNAKLLSLLFAAKTARSLGAVKIILIAPYLPYMRQDKVFERGQGITSAYFAELISHYFDALMTIDPHLHRWHTLSAIYTIPTQVCHARDHISNWIQHHVQSPLLIGPDAESAQWIEGIAKKLNAPFLVLEKIRKGDSDIEVSIPQINPHQHCIPVLMDDIISTGMTMIGAVKHLSSLNMPPPICIGVHAIFADNAYEKLVAAGAAQIVTCNTIPHHSNGIDISQALIEHVEALL